MSKFVIRSPERLRHRRRFPIVVMMRSLNPGWHGSRDGGFVTQRARLPMFVVCAALALTGTVRDDRGILQAQPARPNIVLIFPDNLGWGEVGVYGSVRGALTPRIDKLAAEGLRLNNFNVEFPVPCRARRC